MDRVVEIRRDCQSLFAYAGSEGLEGEDAALAGWVVMGLTLKTKRPVSLELNNGDSRTAPR